MVSDSAPIDETIVCEDFKIVASVKSPNGKYMRELKITQPKEEKYEFEIIIKTRLKQGVKNG